MEWPENYAYSSTNKLMAGTKKLGHTVVPSYQPYTISSSDVLSSPHLLARQTKQDAKVRGGKVRAATYTGTTPFARSVGMTATSLPGYKSLSSRTHSKVSFLPPLALRDTAQMSSCTGKTNRLLSVLTNSTPVFVNN
jgi:hypothetical protein